MTGISIPIRSSNLRSGHIASTPFLRPNKIASLGFSGGWLMVQKLTFEVSDPNVRFGSLADTQSPENIQMAEFGAEDASVSVCFRPKADIQGSRNSPASSGQKFDRSTLDPVQSPCD